MKIEYRRNWYKNILECAKKYVKKNHKKIFFG